MLKISENCRRNIFILGMEYRSSAEKMSLEDDASCVCESDAVWFGAGKRKSGGER